MNLAVLSDWSVLAGVDRHFVNQFGPFVAAHILLSGTVATADEFFEVAASFHDSAVQNEEAVDILAALRINDRIGQVTRANILQGLQSSSSILGGHIVSFEHGVREFVFNTATVNIVEGDIKIVSGKRHHRDLQRIAATRLLNRHNRIRYNSYHYK